MVPENRAIQQQDYFPPFKYQLKRTYGAQKQQHANFKRSQPRFTLTQKLKWVSKYQTSKEFIWLKSVWLNKCLIYKLYPK